MTLPVTEISNECPYCGVHHECATPTTGNTNDVPTAGAISVCIQCGESSVFAEDLSLRLPTAEEAGVIAGDKQIQLAKKLIIARKKEN